MKKIPKLNNPPIKEAVIDFQFQPFFDFENIDINEYKEILKPNYSK